MINANLDSIPVTVSLAGAAVTKHPKLRTAEISPLPDLEAEAHIKERAGWAPSSGSQGDLLQALSQLLGVASSPGCSKACNDHPTPVLVCVSVSDHPSPCEDSSPCHQHGLILT